MQRAAPSGSDNTVFAAMWMILTSRWRRRLGTQLVLAATIALAGGAVLLLFTRLNDGGGDSHVTVDEVRIQR